jgi:putative CocE/NonD family hydrolase
MVGAGGVELATWIHLPGATGSFDTLFVRTPYRATRYAEVAGSWTRRGYAFVGQDVRGRHGSGRTWECYRGEDHDGAAALAWIRSQRWSNGRVHVVGESYAGFAALAASTGAAHAQSATVVGPTLGLGRTALDRGGGFRLLDTLTWHLGIGCGRRGNAAFAPRMVESALRAMPEATLADLIALLPAIEPIMARILVGEEDRLPLERVATRTLCIGGFQDPMVENAIEVFRRLAPHVPRRLVLGPWTHELGAERALDPSGARAALRHLASIEQDWIETKRCDSRPAVTVFIDGVHEPLTAYGWPFPGTGELALRLDRSASGSEPILFRSEPLARDEVVVGHPRFQAELVAADPGTMVFVKLWAELDGNRLLLCEGMSTVPTVARPQRFEMALRPAGVLLRKGLRLALTVACEDFPRYAARPVSALSDRIAFRPGEPRPVARLAHAVRLALPVLRPAGP